MDDYQKQAAPARINDLSRLEVDQRAFETHFTPEQLETMAKLESAAREIAGEISSKIEEKLVDKHAQERVDYKGAKWNLLKLSVADRDRRHYYSDSWPKLSVADRIEVSELFLKFHCLEILRLIPINGEDPRSADAIGDRVRNIKNLFGLIGGESYDYASYHPEPFKSGVPMLNGPEELAAMLAVKDEIEKRAGENFSSLFQAIKTANESDLEVMRQQQNKG